MRATVLLICVFVLASCNPYTDSPREKNIREFERLLGEKECRNLNTIIDEFDQYLEEKYGPGLDTNLFVYYYIDMQRTGTLHYIDLDSSRFFCDNLFNEYSIEYPDSIWVDSLIHIKYPSSPIHEFRALPAPDDEAVKAWIARRKKKPVIRISKTGSYFSALDSLKNNDTLIGHYLENKYAIGSIAPNLLAGGLINYLDDESEYFCKRMTSGIY